MGVPLKFLKAHNIAIEKEYEILSEYEEQVKLAEWMRETYPWPRYLWTATVGGVRLSMGSAVKLKRSGYNKGVPDLNFFEPCNGFRGLFIEMKKQKGGVISPEQKQWQIELCKRGYFACVCMGFEDAKKVVVNYLGNPKQ